ncbi:MAG: putative beta-lysine N-acetyltransferase [Deltaproteobacteria bacterium]|nr:MAG: putative beta-lysine N-acetyltransferase [Deltaproteobacteria bacterium]
MTAPTSSRSTERLTGVHALTDPADEPSGDVEPTGSVPSGSGGVQAPCTTGSGLPVIGSLHDAEGREPGCSVGHSAGPSEGDAEGAGEWASTQPSKKGMGLVRLTLDRGVKTTAIGQLYGLDFEIEGAGYEVKLFFDHYNRRLKVIDYEARDYGAMVHHISWLAEANEFDKVFLKAERGDWQRFLPWGYQLEGILKYYFRGEDAYVMSRFRSNERLHSPHLMEETTLIESVMQRPRAYTPPPLPEGYRLVRATPEDIPALVSIYRSVFQTYPSPLTHPDYILATMERHILYRAVKNAEGSIVSAASAEVDEKHSNAEMTDCATNPSERGRGLMFHLLRALEQDLAERGIMTAYTLARAMSAGMNVVFYRLGYEFCGRLINNCDIYGCFEDMNIWVHPLSPVRMGES